ncbi:hypothetical protein PPO43_03305 [Saprospira sp. CCB-QB6]|uniref:hypothetical protein n=1 Tax=Saprospira sp. CCB-QB6 TaxID=3023936 RepID=UPI00234AB41C|nr:hypothetical protein [Saprospira sp. CCB-QB6]WCL82129.1 hypothetical protein PPO43_03305 [Saprospira sp. CCB-QB6]
MRPTSRQLQIDSAPIALSLEELPDSAQIAVETLAQKSCDCLTHFQDSLNLFLQEANVSLAKIKSDSSLEHPADLLQQIVHHPQLSAALSFGQCLSIAQSQSPELLASIQAKQNQQLSLQELLKLELPLIEEQMAQNCPKQQPLFKAFNEFGQAMNSFQKGQ